MSNTPQARARSGDRLSLATVLTFGSVERESMADELTGEPLLRPAAE